MKMKASLKTGFMFSVVVFKPSFFKSFLND